MSRLHSLILLILVASSLSFGQRGSGAGRIPGGDGNSSGLIVHVVYAGELPAGEKINVRVDSANGGTVGENFTNDEGFATFSVSPGLYVIKVRGASIKPATSEIISIESFEKLHHEYIRTQLVDSGDSNAETASRNIPEKARKEFEMGTEALSKGDSAASIQHYRRATELYPQFAMAYNNLAAVYMKSNDMALARQAMSKALKVDPNLSFTQANFIRLTLLEQNYNEAIALSQKALSKDPSSPEFLLLMCRAQLLAEHFDEALVYARKLTGGPHEKFESTHMLAARALEAQKRLDEAKLEYQALLTHSPNAPEADEARALIMRLKHLVTK